MTGPGRAAAAAARQVRYAGVPSGLATQRVLRFRPRPGQEGTTHRVCFSVFDNVDKSAFRCFSLTVTRAEVTWQSPGWPVAATGGLLPLAALAGCTYRFSLSATSQYRLAVAAQALPQVPLCSAALVPTGIECLLLDRPPPPGAAFAPAGGGGGLVVGVPACRTSGGGGGGGGPCCGDGRCNGAESRSGCPADCREDDGLAVESAEPQVVAGSLSTALGQYMTEAQLAWIPPRGLAGRAVLLCLVAAPPGGGAGLVSTVRIGRQGPTLCLYAEVERCRYCVPPGASMADAAARLLRTANWPLLYNANPGVERPGLLGPGPDSALTVGPVYAVRPGESLLSIAGGRSL